MNANETAPQETGLQFFGKLSASVSHDLKNVLSIINEKAGLLEDFCHMARQGMAIDMDRIDAVTAQVKGQVERADQIIRCFNRFAHSTDHPVAPMDLGESVATLVQLAQRLLAQMEVAADVQPAKTPVVIITRPLMAQELIWAGIQWVAGRLGAKKEITIATDRAGEGARVLIGPAANVPAGIDETTAAIATEEMTQALQAELSLDPTSGMLQIRLASLQAPP
jgi:light-regulated signal transduction histidine kinase (bacteriophytochrome)